jgi:phytoene desaturase
MSKKIAVIGAGLSGLASATLLAKAGHKVTVFEGNSWIGGKSRRFEDYDWRFDTGPAIITFPRMFILFDTMYNALGERTHETLELQLQRLPEIGKYFFRGEEVILPIPEGHRLYPSWQRFEKEHAGLNLFVEDLMVMDPRDPRTLPAVGKLLSRYGLNLTTTRYLNSLSWMEEELKEIIAIHTLNAGVAPNDSLALYASITAIMSKDGVYVPKGGVNQLARSLARKAKGWGADIRLDTPVTKLTKRTIHTDQGSESFDYVISSVDPSVLKHLQTGKSEKWKKRSCSGVAIYALLKEPLPEGTSMHSVIMPDEPNKMHKALAENRPPEQTMTFVNYYLPQDIYPNVAPSIAVLLTAPSDGESYDAESPWVKKELDRITQVMKLPKHITEYFDPEVKVVLDPQYFGSFGASGGALYGRTRKLWISGPFRLPSYNNPLKPWLWQVGAAVHPGGGIPAILGGVMISTRRLFKKLENN